MTLDFLKGATADELRRMKNMIDEELTVRKNKEKEQLWSEFVQATEKYIRKFGGIEISNQDGETTYLDMDYDFSIIGEIIP